MCCAACPARIAAALRALPGVGAVALEEQACKVRVAFDAEATGPRAIRDALVSLGYDAEPLAPEDAAGGADEAAAEIAEWRRLFLGALLFTAPLVVLMMVLPYIPAANRVIMFELLPARLRSSSAAGAHADMAGMAEGGAAPASKSGGRSLPLMSVLAWALATPVQFVFGARFMVGCAHLRFVAHSHQRRRFCADKRDTAAGRCARCAWAPPTWTCWSPLAPGARRRPCHRIPHRA
jgi:cation transport ATPase